MANFQKDLQPSEDRGHLLTEQANPLSINLDQLETPSLVNLFIEEDLRPQQAVAGAAPALSEAVDAIAERLRCGGRLYYLGAGTSGRLGVLDAAECPPTFCSDPEWCRACWPADRCAAAQFRRPRRPGDGRPLDSMRGRSVPRTAWWVSLQVAPRPM